MKKCPRCGKEFPDNLNTCPEEGERLADVKSKADQDVSLLPYLSNILGLILIIVIIGFVATMRIQPDFTFLSLLLVFGPIIGIAAIASGHLAQYDARNFEPKNGKRASAMLGLITGYTGTIFTVAALVFAIFHPIKSRPTAINCASNLKNIGLAMRIYAVDHGNMLPKNLMEITNELPNPNTLICPDDPHHKEFSRGQAPFWSATNVSYEFLTPGAPDDEDPNRVMMRCPIHGWELMADGSVHRPQTNK